jgi:hypothetical protein
VCYEHLFRTYKDKEKNQINNLPKHFGNESYHLPLGIQATWVICSSSLNRSFTHAYVTREPKRVELYIEIALLTNGGSPQSIASKYNKLNYSIRSIYRTVI